MVHTLLAGKLSSGDYGSIMRTGRYTSAILDWSIAILVFLITRRLTGRASPALLAAFFYSVSVLPIQLAHFFAVDTFLVFFLVLSFYFLISPFPYLLGLSFGLAIAAKISASIFLPIIALGLIVYFFRTRNLFKWLLLLITIVISFYFTVRLAQPYLFADSRLLSFSLNSKVLTNWQELKNMSRADSYFPPAIQWIHTRPVLYSLENLILWGLGVPLALISFLSLLQLVNRLKYQPLLILPLLWILGVFIYYSTQFAQPIRYFYPAFPFLAVLSGSGFFQLLSRLPRYRIHILTLTLPLTLIWPLAFITIYSRPHSRVSASTWINTHIPPGSRISCEHWDDCLPLGYNAPYRIIEFPLYAQDTPEKWQDMATRLAGLDYIILSSNRLYGSIMTVPEIYPATNLFYRDLFADNLGFSKIAEFTSRPNLPLPGTHICLTPPFIKYGVVTRASQECPLPGINFVDDYADETFTVYDHPKVIIFKKNNAL